MLRMYIIIIRAVTKKKIEISLLKMPTGKLKWNSKNYWNSHLKKDRKGKIDKKKKTRGKEETKNGRYKSNHINNYIKPFGINSPIKM